MNAYLDTLNPLVDSPNRFLANWVLERHSLVTGV